MDTIRTRTVSSSGVVFDSETAASYSQARSSLSRGEVSHRNWELVRQAFLDDTAPVPILMPEGTYLRSSCSRSSTAPRNIDSVVSAMETAQMPFQTASERMLSRETSLPTESSIPNEPTTATPTQKWGSREETDELNRDIQECLRIEGVASPEVFFTEPVECFQSAAHFYVHLTKRLDGVDIDLYESLSSHLGLEHPLVKDMTKLLEQEPQRTYLSREPTDIQSERIEEGMRVGVPGMQAFSEECRALSWVIRTGPRIVNRPTDSSTGGHVTPTLVHSTAVGQEEQKVDSGQVVCPLPVSYDGHEMPQRPAAAYNRPPPKQTMWSRVLGCFCFVSS